MQNLLVFATGVEATLVCVSLNTHDPYWGVCGFAALFILTAIGLVFDL
jgi:hypothetical protein